MRNIYTAGIPLQVTRQTDILAVTSPDKTSDIIAAIANPQIHGGEQYTVRSWVDVAHGSSVKTVGRNQLPGID